LDGEAWPVLDEERDLRWVIVGMGEVSAMFCVTPVAEWDEAVWTAGGGKVAEVVVSWLATPVMLPTTS